MAGDVAQGDAQRNGGIEHACSVEMHGDASVGSHAGDTAQVIEAGNATAGMVVAAFQANQRGWCAGAVIVGTQGRLQEIQVHFPVNRGNRDGIKSGQTGHAAHLRSGHMRQGVNDNLSACRCMAQGRHEIAHDAAADQESVFLAGQRCCHKLQLAHDGIARQGVVAQLRVAHGLQHGRLHGFGRPGNGIAA